MDRETVMRETAIHKVLKDAYIIHFSIITARGFGMRVVGGKTGTDGRLFAYIVWTVPGGPAEKGGLQQGDKVSSDYVKIASDQFITICVSYY